MPLPTETGQANFETIYREEAARVLATLIRLLGSFDLAEEVTQEAFTIALQQWPIEGLPANPRAWLISTARHKALDLIRRRASFADKQTELVHFLQPCEHEAPAQEAAMLQAEQPIEDDLLRLIFTCCHPALSQETQVALTLRTLCSLETEQIARAFLVPVTTMQQRIVRAKQKIRDAGIPYRVPSREDLPQRISAVALTVYLVFNEGYTHNNREFAGEAIRLARLLHRLMPTEAELTGLLALLLLQDSRAAARLSAEGDLILLEEQDRSLWNRTQIDEGLVLVEEALRQGPAGPYALQSVIAALHAQAQTAAATDWPQIAALYTLLYRQQPTPIIELNRAAAIAMADGEEAGLTLLAEIEQRGDLKSYGHFYAAKGELLRRLDRRDEAAAAYERALGLVCSKEEERFLSKRIASLR